MKSKSTLITTIVIVLIVVGLIGLIAYSVIAKNKREEALGQALTPFAQCLKDSGALFYGAFWCPHCHDQKEIFGTAVASLPYVECSNPDQSQNQLCNEKKIGRYPTWEFKGERVESVLSLAELSQRSGCQLPEGIN